MNASVRRAARQQLEASLLMGVDFVPLTLVDVVLPESEPAEEPSATKPLVAAAPATVPNTAGSLDALRDLHARECPLCTKVTTYTNIVFGEGNPQSDLMFVGEAPGAEEDRTGRPFVGRAGQKLDEIIRAMKLRREDVYIANVLKSRPPNNRTPTPDEVDQCGPYLVEQIRLIRPQVIVTLGGPATKLLLNTKEGITRVRGSWASFDDGGRKIPVMPTFHPAYLLRNYTRDTREKVWSDMKAVLGRLGKD